MKKLIVGFLFVGAAFLTSCNDDNLPGANFSLFQAEKITAAAGDREVTLTWVPSDKETPQEYLVMWVAGTAGIEGGSKSVAGDVTTLKVDGLVNAVKYTFSVQARYPEGLSGKVTATVTPVTSRYNVTDFLAEAGADKVRLTWKKPTQGADRLQGYTVTVMPGDRKIEISDKSAERYFVDGLTSGTAYTFKLTVRYTNGDSDGVSSAATPGEISPINVSSAELARSEPATFACNDLYFMGDIASVSWMFGDGGTSTELKPTHKYTAKGTYTVKVTVTYTGGKSSEQGQIEMKVVDFKWSSKALLYGDYSGAVKASNPVFSPDGGTLYIPTSNGKGHLFAINAYTGEIKWVYEIDAVTYGGGVAVGADGTIYQGSNNKKFHAIKPDGKAMWVFDAPANIEAFPAVTSDGKVYFCCVDQTQVAAYALDAAKGTQIWVNKIDGATGSAVAVDASGNVYFGTSKAVYSFDAAGNQRWRTTDINVTERGSMAISGTTLFAALKGGAGVASIDMSNGKINWQSGLASGDSYFPVVDKTGVVFFADKGTGKIFAVNPDGQKKWDADSGSALIYAGLTLSSDGKLYVGTQKTGAFKLLGADAATGNLFLNEAAADQVMSAFSIGPDGRLYYGTVSGKILTRELNAELESGSWSMRGGNAQGSNSLK